MNGITQFDISLADDSEDKIEIGSSGNQNKNNKYCSGSRFRTNKIMGKDTSITGMTLSPNSTAIPCGLYASYYP